MFYWLIESQRNPTTDPLVFWYQGGPGCSGLLGLLSEHGPLTPAKSGGGLVYNQLSWTNVANVVYLEAPVGVGFSYSNQTFYPSDNSTALDNFNFLEGFLEEYPEYVGRDTWTTGESYGGVYVPTLAYQVVSHPTSQIAKQLKGMMVGNGVFRCMNTDAIDMNLIYYHGLVSYTNFNAWNTNNCPSNPNSLVCKQIMKVTLDQIGTIDQELLPSNIQPSLDPDNLYQDFCSGNASLSFTETGGWPNCAADSVGELATTYLNRVDVQSAIHAKPTKWNICNDVGYISQGFSLVPYYQAIPTLKPSFNILVYSGDVDILTVPFAHTQPCLFQLNRPNKQVWGPWYVNGATAGYVEYFDTYTYATIKGAGHEAPEYQPLNSLAMFDRFLTKQNITMPLSSSTGTVKRPPSQGSLLRKVMGKNY